MSTKYFKSYDEIYDILASHIGEDNVFYRYMSASTLGEVVAFFYLSSSEPLFADDEIHTVKASINIQIYASEEQMYSDEVRSLVKDLIKKYQVTPDFTNQVPQLENYSCYVFDIPATIDIEEWI